MDLAFIEVTRYGSQHRVFINTATIVSIDETDSGCYIYFGENDAHCVFVSETYDQIKEMISDFEDGF